MSRVQFLLSIALVVLGCFLPSSADSQSVSGKDVVSPTAAASFNPVARGMTLQLSVVLNIRSGFHVNAREVSANYLIPTDLRVELPAGFKSGEIVYPKGTLQTFAFAKNKQLNVYTDSVTLTLPVTVLASAPLGTQHIPLNLHYQACSSEICLPPVTKSFDAVLDIVADRKSAKPSH
jgi:DsbC/DsbD-like thiol-disulfide interchange protein